MAPSSIELSAVALATPLRGRNARDLGDGGGRGGVATFDLDRRFHGLVASRSRFIHGQTPTTAWLRAAPGGADAARRSVGVVRLVAAAPVGGRAAGCVAVRAGPARAA